MSAGSILLTIAAILLFCGLLQRTLDRMYLTDRQAWFIIGAMLLGTFLPDVTFGSISVSIGGALIPLTICVYVLLKCDSAMERWRTLLGVVLTGLGVYSLSALLPSEAEAMLMDPLWLYGACAGILAWLLGRSRRGAFVCGVAGTLLADIVSAIVTRAQGYQTQLFLGGAGIADAAVISGVLGVLLCETVGELIERIVRSDIKETKQ